MFLVVLLNFCYIFYLLARSGQVRSFALKSAKILLLPPKYEIIMVPSNQSFFQYCDSNIELFFIAPCKVITLNPLCSLFWYQFFAFFLKLSLFQLSL